MNERTIESKTANTVLERRTTVEIGEKSYFVAPPSTATIIMLSEAVSRLPHIALDPEKVVDECLAVGKDCRVLGEIAAILILGAKNCVTERKRVLVKGKRYLFGLIDTRVYEVTLSDPKKELAEEILEECSPRQLFNVISHILGQLELSDFFGLTTFLTEINLLRQTKVEKRTTASGLS